MAALTPNGLYTFSTIAPSVLGSTFTNVRLMESMGYSSALRYANIELLQRQILPYLLPGTPLDLKRYEFHRFHVGTDANNKPIYVVVADHWVTTDGFVLTSSVDAVIRIFNIDPVESVQMVREQLRLLGFTFTIETVDH